MNQRGYTIGLRGRRHEIILVTIQCWNSAFRIGKQLYLDRKKDKSEIVEGLAFCHEVIKSQIVENSAL